MSLSISYRRIDISGTTKCELKILPFAILKMHLVAIVPKSNPFFVMRRQRRAFTSTVTNKDKDAVKMPKIFISALIVLKLRLCVHIFSTSTVSISLLLIIQLLSESQH